jgi:predicted O-methyltransferase YrrM
MPAPNPAAPQPASPQPNRTEPPLLCWPLDHFYSPVPDNRALAREPARSRVWPAVPRPTLGIDWRGDEQVALVRDQLATQEPIDLPSLPTGNPHDYHTANEMFSRLDAWMLQGVLRHFRPRRMVEVGCGWSSLLTARVNREYLDRQLHFTCIEPYPPEFLTGGVDGISELVVAPVQEAPLDKFLSLSDGDVLFIDSSHTVKTGGDVPYLFEEILPRLARGVVIHVHDIALPRDYPEEWVLAGRAWNEQYLVHAFLAFNSAFRILLGVSWLNVNRADALAEVLPDYPQAYGDSGASLWMQRIG